MLMSGLAVYVFLFVLVPLGGLTGFGAGRLARGLTRAENSCGRDLLNIGLGIAGFITGAYASTMNASLYEEWLNGALVVRRVTGLVDYFWFLTYSGGILLPFSAEILFKLIHERRAKRCLVR